MDVCVLGLGEVGLPTARYVQGKGVKVWGYDISQKAVERARKAGVVNSTNNWKRVPPCDAYIICVSTGLKEKKPDLSQVIKACVRIKSRANPSAIPLVCIESTVTPNLCQRVFKETFDRKVHLVHVPHRYWAEDPKKHGVRQMRVIGAIDADSLEAGLKFYRDVLHIPLHAVSSAEEAEMSKIVENAYRYVQIAFAEELRMICEKIGIEFSDVREACNTKWNIDIPESRDGIGGHCIPMGIQYVASLKAFSTLLECAMNADEQYRKWLADKR